MISAALRDRYLRDSPPVRLGGLAADLARLASCAGHPQNREVVASLLEEGKHFAEWAAPEAPLETQAVLADIQVALAVWQRRWLSGAPAATMRTEAKQRSEELLALAGLVRTRS